MRNISKAIVFATITLMPLLASADWKRSRSCSNNRGVHLSRPMHPAPFRGAQPSYSRPSGFFSDRSIWEGARSGRLSDREVAQLRRDAWNIRDEQARYSADGVITRREREDLRNDMGAFHDDLRHELNDGERRMYCKSSTHPVGAVN